MRFSKNKNAKNIFEKITNLIVYKQFLTRDKNKTPV